MPNSDFVQKIWFETSALYGGTAQFKEGVLNDADNFLNGNNNGKLEELFVKLMQTTANMIVEIDRAKRPEEFAALVRLLSLQLQLFYNILGCQDPETIKEFGEFIQFILNQIVEILQSFRQMDISMPDSFSSFIKLYSVRVKQIELLVKHLTKIINENLI
jgi:hypothetical protein